MSREKKLKNRIRSQNKMMRRAADVLNATAESQQLVHERNLFWKNLMVASAFARGLGNERPISEVIFELHPAHLRMQE